MRASLVVFAVAGTIGCSSRPAAVVVASAGEPALVETSVNGTIAALTEADYKIEAAKRAGDKGFIPIRTKPAGLSARATFGIGLLDRNECWALDQDPATGYVLYGDFNANGDLSDDNPRRFVDEGGKPTLRVTMTRRADDGEPYPIALKLQLDMVKRPGTTGKTLALVRYATTRRHGQIDLGNGHPPVAFRMTGLNGLFGVNYASIAFDVDRSGTFDPDIERYEIPEQYVNLDSETFTFAVEPHGNRVTLTRVPSRPERALLKTGYAAPEFAFTDLAGATHRLSDFRGRVVLLDFWGVWCGPCVAGVPELVRLYAKYHARGFDIIGIEAKDAREKVAAFIAEKRMPWMQTLEKDSDPATTLYRVTGWPTAFLVGADGRFLVANYRGDVDLAAELAKAFPGADE